MISALFVNSKLQMTKTSTAGIQVDFIWRTMPLEEPVNKQ
jgi:hypothetical protein